jgi:predicted secreted hydrolase
VEEKEKQSYLAYFNGKRGAEQNPTNYQRRDDGSHIFHNEEEYYEWWYFDASFSNGYHMVITFHYRNLFLKPMVPSLQFFIYRPDGTRVDRYAICDSEKISAHPDYCDVRMAESWVRDRGDHYELYINIKGDGARLNLKNTVPSWKLGSGFNYKNEETGLVAGWVVPMPHAHVEGELFIKDEIIAVEGSAYHDHNWGNFHCYKTFRRWYWGRIHSERYTVDYAKVIPRDEEAPLVTPLLLARGNDIILSTDMLDVELDNVERDEQTGQDYAQRLVLTADALGVKISVEINSHRVIEFMKLPRVTDWDHYYFRFLADYRMSLEIDGIKESAGGEHLFELMML